jgi:chaperonin GroES
MAATATQINLKPIADRVVIEIREEDETRQTSGGILLPDSAREKPQRGVVVAVGPGKTLESGQKETMTVKTGDVVLFQKYGGTDLKLDGRDLKIVSERDILAIVEG